MQYLKTIFIGFCMGAIDVIPGVSGGTVALIMGIYERLVFAISQVLHVQTVQEIVSWQLKTLWKRIDGTFLLSLALGIFIGIVTIAKVLETLLVQYPEQMWALFFGAVLCSIWLVAQQIKHWSFTYISTVLVAAAIAWIFVSLQVINTPNTWWMLILTGMVASCAMILPGVSGAFLLVILGKYALIIQAVNTRDFTTIALVGFGAIMGIACFAWVLRYALAHYHNATFCVLTGLLLGSVWRLWPWKLAPTDVQSASILPSMNSTTIITILCIVLGVVAVWGLHSFSRK